MVVYNIEIPIYAFLIYQVTLYMYIEGFGRRKFSPILSPALSVKSHDLLSCVNDYNNREYYYGDLYYIGELKFLAM